MTNQNKNLAQGITGVFQLYILVMSFILSNM